MPKSLSFGSTLPALSKVEGFTLIELMVVITIIAILVIVLLPQLGQFNQSQSLSNSAYDLATSLRTAQNNATSGLTCSPGISAANWFVRFYYDNTYGWTYNTGNNCPPSLGAAPTPILTSTGHVWLAGVSLNSIIINGDPNTTISLNSSNTNNYDVLFDNINGQVIFSTSDPGYLSSYPNANYIQVKLSTSTSCQIVIIQKGGSVNVQSNPTCP